jgi:hypothetical protein
MAGSGRGLIEVHSLHLLGGTEETMKNFGHDSRCPAQIRSEYFLSTRLECYGRANLHGKTVFEFISWK